MPKVINSFTIREMIITLRISSIILLLFSVLFLAASIYSLTWDIKVDLIQTFDNIYSAISKYSGLYKFTLVVTGFWITLRRLKLSLDIDDKSVNTETITHCNKYYEDFQLEFSKYSKIHSEYSLLVRWSKLIDFNKEEFQKEYMGTNFIRITRMNENNRNEIVLILNKLEAFSALITQGNLDSMLAKKIIGSTYTYQVGMLLGIISFYRTKDNPDFMINTISLYKQWTADVE